MSEQPSAEWCQGHSRGYERGFRDGLAKGRVEIKRLEERMGLIDAAESQMIGEDAQPLPEWEWYFDAQAFAEAALDQQEGGE